MSAVNIAVGQLVISSAGRDSAGVYLVVGINGKGQLMLADGRGRKVSRPKLKNRRHVKVLKLIAHGVAEKLQTSLRVTDEELRQAISVLYKPDNL